MPVVSPPKYVISALRTLEHGGFEAYMVGGCVRDVLLGRRPQDWDICTSASPAQVQALFPRTHPTGLKHGTVTVVSSGHPLEVTTYRADGQYSDHRRPESVRFVGSLSEDLQRRDFTINAMALSPEGELHDPFGGQADIKSRLLRCVGDPEKRFDEDALRMLRALRFSAVLDFDIEPSTWKAMEKLAPLTGALAAERVCAELQKALCSGHPEKVSKMISLGLLCSVFDQNRPVFELSVLRGLPKAANARWAGLCAVLRHENFIADTAVFLKSLRLESAMIKSVSAGVEAALSPPPACAADWKRLSAAIGDEGCACAAAAAEALGRKGSAALWKSVLQKDECRSLGQLAVSGSDLLELGFEGPELGKALSLLLSHVIDHPSENRRDLLKNRAARML